MSLPKTLLQIAGVPPQIPDWSKSVLILIDHQMEYITGGVQLVGREPAVEEMRKLLANARAAGAPVIHVIHLGRPGGALFDPDRQLVEIIPILEPVAGESVVIKNLPNSFANTDLDRRLKALGRTSIVLAGFATHMCVSATARSGIDHGYQVTVVGEACATRDLPGAFGDVIPAQVLHNATLAALADRFATVVRNADAIA